MPRSGKGKSRYTCPPSKGTHVVKKYSSKVSQWQREVAKRNLPVSTTEWQEVAKAARPLLEKHGVELGRVLGCGTFACAYEVDGRSDVIAKLTGDPADAAAWQLVINEVGSGTWPKGLAQVHCVEEIPEKSKKGRKLYFMIQERMTPITKEEGRFIEAGNTEDPDDRIVVRAILEGNRRAVKALSDQAREVKLANVPYKLLDQVIDIIEWLRGIGIVWHDLKADNVMSSGSGKARQIKITDLGYSEVPDTRVPVMTKGGKTSSRGRAPSRKKSGHSASERRGSSANPLGASWVLVDMLRDDPSSYTSTGEFRFTTPDNPSPDPRTSHTLLPTWISQVVEATDPANPPLRDVALEAWKEIPEVDSLFQEKSHDGYPLTDRAEQVITKAYRIGYGRLFQTFGNFLAKLLDEIADIPSDLTPNDRQNLTENKSALKRAIDRLSRYSSAEPLSWKEAQNIVRETDWDRDQLGAPPDFYIDSGMYDIKGLLKALLSEAATFEGKEYSNTDKNVKDEVVAAVITARVVSDLPKSIAYIRTYLEGQQVAAARRALREHQAKPRPDWTRDRKASRDYNRILKDLTAREVELSKDWMGPAQQDAAAEGWRDFIRFFIEENPDPWGILPKGKKGGGSGIHSRREARRGGGSHRGPQRHSSMMYFGPTARADLMPSYQQAALLEMSHPWMERKSKGTDTPFPFYEALEVLRDALAERGVEKVLPWPKIMGEENDPYGLSEIFSFQPPPAEKRTGWRVAPPPAPLSPTLYMIRGIQAVYNDRKTPRELKGLALHAWNTCPYGSLLVHALPEKGVGALSRSARIDLFQKGFQVLAEGEGSSATGLQPLRGRWDDLWAFFEKIKELSREGAVLTSEDAPLVPEMRWPKTPQGEAARKGYERLSGLFQPEFEAYWSEIQEVLFGVIAVFFLEIEKATEEEPYKRNPKIRLPGFQAMSLADDVRHYIPEPPPVPFLSSKTPSMFDHAEHASSARGSRKTRSSGHSAARREGAFDILSGLG